MDSAWGGLRALLARRRVALGFVTAVAALWLARPTWTSWALGFVVAAAGEAIRIWAAGHIEKGLEVTTSGPYRFTRHPLYAGSSVMAAGVMIAARSLPLAVIGAAYMAATLAAAIGSEEAHLRQKFGVAYDRYARAEGSPIRRSFSFERAMRNREYRAAGGLLAGFLILALKVAFTL